MKLKLAMVFFAATALITGCNNNADSDGVPKIDPNNIIVDGEKMTESDFIQKYCLGKRENKTCWEVLQVSRKKSRNGKMPNW